LTSRQICNGLAKLCQPRARLVTRLTRFEKMPEHVLLVGAHDAGMNAADDAPFLSDREEQFVVVSFAQASIPMARPLRW
jgi:hypothetical protein